MLGQFSMSHPQAAILRQLTEYIVKATACALNRLPYGGNPVGAWLAGAVPHRGPGGSEVSAGLNSAGMLKSNCSHWLLWNFEPDVDVDDPATACSVLKAADQVVAVTEFANKRLYEVATVILPLAPAAESEGTVHNFDGQVMNYEAAGRPTGDSRPGWKILRRLGAELKLPDFNETLLAEVQAEMNSEIEKGLMAGVSGAELKALEHAPAKDELWRIGDVPLYAVDGLCRRAGALQQTAQADTDFAGFNPADAEALGLRSGKSVTVQQGDGKAVLEARIMQDVPVGAIWVKSATAATAGLGAAIGPLVVEAD